MDYITVDNALNRERVFGILDALASGFRKNTYEGAERIASAYEGLKVTLDDKQYQVRVPVRQDDELEDLKGRIEQATDMLRVAFRRPQYVGTAAFEAVEDVLWVLAGEPDGADL